MIDFLNKLPTDIVLAIAVFAVIFLLILLILIVFSVLQGREVIFRLAVPQ